MNEAIRVAQRQESMDQTLQVLLEFVGKNLEAGRAYIFEKDDHDHDHNTYEWVAKGVAPEKDTFRIYRRRSSRNGIGSLMRIRVLSQRIWKK